MENNIKKMKIKALAAGFVAGVVVANMLSRKMRHKSYQWANGMRDDVMCQVRETKDITREKYNQIIEGLRPKYKAMKNISAREMKDLVNELKSHWQTIAQEAKKQMSSAGNSPQEQKPASATAEKQIAAFKRR